MQEKMVFGACRRCDWRWREHVIGVRDKVNTEELMSVNEITDTDGKQGIKLFHVLYILEIRWNFYPDGAVGFI